MNETHTTNPAERLNQYTAAHADDFEGDIWGDIIWQLNLDEEWLTDTDGDLDFDSDIFLADGTCIIWCPADQGQPWQTAGPWKMGNTSWTAQKEWDER